LGTVVTTAPLHFAPGISFGEAQSYDFFTAPFSSQSIPKSFSGAVFLTFRPKK